MPGIKYFANRWKYLRNRRRILEQFREFSKLRGDTRSDFEAIAEDQYFCFDDGKTNTPFDPHYLYHTAWAARILKQIAPIEHIDISSYLYFVAIASAFVPIRHLDYRPPLLSLDGVSCDRGDLHALPFRDGEVTSLSCMHVIEHVGLGRYGEPLDCLGDVKAARELSRVLAPKGNLLFVAPVGKPRICFNAHRIYSFRMIMDMFGDLTFKEWALITDDGKEGLVANASPELCANQSYGCGCFWFSKDSTTSESKT
jgi:SAM-dependent methyltransferase